MAQASTELARRAARAVPDPTTAPVHACVDDFIFAVFLRPIRQMLHAGAGLDVSRHGQSISQLSLAAATEPTTALLPTDIEVRRHGGL